MEIPILFECDLIQQGNYNYLVIEMLNCMYQLRNEANLRRFQIYMDHIISGYSTTPSEQGFICSALLASERERDNYSELIIGGFLEGKPERLLCFTSHDIPIREFTKSDEITHYIIKNQSLWHDLSNNYLMYVEFCRNVYRVKHMLEHYSKSKLMAVAKVKVESIFEEQQRLNYISRDMCDRLLSCITKRNKSLKLDIQYKVMDTMTEVLKNDLYKVVKCVGYEAAIIKDEHFYDKNMEAINDLACTFALSDNAENFIKACDEFTLINKKKHTFLFNRVPSDAALFENAESNLDFSYL